MPTFDTSLNGADAAPQMLGTNQSGVRAHNERLVLSVLRKNGPIAKAEIARLTTLSAQTVSVIMRALESERMILRDEPLRGKVGQPSVPMRLDPDGAFFHGVTIGRRHADHLLVDMVGNIRQAEHIAYDYPDPDKIESFILETTRQLQDALSPEQLGRVGGMGVARPNRLWHWPSDENPPTRKVEAWKDTEMFDRLSRKLGIDVLVQNDASSACGAEIVFGSAGRDTSALLHIYFDYFVGGGLILDGQLFTGRTGNAGAIGSICVQQTDGSHKRLLEVSSLYLLERMARDAGKQDIDLWHTSSDWSGLEPELSDWIERIVPGLAQAVTVVSRVVDIEAVIVDGHMPADVRQRIVSHLERTLEEYDFDGLKRPAMVEGTVGADAPSLGAAALPLARKYLI